MESVIKKYLVVLLLVFTANVLLSQEKPLRIYNNNPNKLSYVMQDSVKHPWIAAIEVAGLNVFVNRFNYYLRPETDFSTVSLKSWKANFEHGLEWDWNNFTVNYVGHPYQGAQYYNASRSLGMDYWASGAYTFMGSATWEWLGETHPPSGNDLVNTTMGGMFLGEVMYRFSDRIYDGKAVGFNRVWREFAAFLLNPMRGFNRGMYGRLKSYEIGPGVVKPMFNGSVSFGGGMLSTHHGYKEDGQTALLETKLVYGDPFDERIKKKKPFDYFVLEGWYRVRNDTAKTRHISLSGYGNMIMKDITGVDDEGNRKKAKHSIGMYHQYDYLDGGIIEIGSMAITAGLVSDFKLSEKFKIRTTAMAGPMILGGSNSEVVDATLHSDDPTDLRDYVMGPGITEKYEVEVNGSKLGILELKLHRWDIFVASGPAGRERLNVWTVDYEIPVYKQLYIGARYIYYDRKATYDDFDDIEKNEDEFRTYITLRF